MTRINAARVEWFHDLPCLLCDQTVRLGYDPVARCCISQHGPNPECVLILTDREMWEESINPTGPARTEAWYRRIHDREAAAGG